MIRRVYKGQLRKFSREPSTTTQLLVLGMNVLLAGGIIWKTEKNRNNLLKKMDLERKKWNLERKQ